MTDRPGGAPFINRLPKSVVDRYEAEQHKTASQDEGDTRTKYCGICDRDLPRHAFDLDLRYADGRKAVCKECRTSLGLGK